MEVGRDRAVGRAEAVGNAALASSNQVVMEAESCILCGAPPPLTAEHIWPDWYNRQQPNLRYELESEIDGGETKRRKTQALNLKPRVLCLANKCNGTWGSRLEENVKPILTPMISRAKRDLAPARSAPLVRLVLSQEHGGGIPRHSDRRSVLPPRGWASTPNHSSAARLVPHLDGALCGRTSECRLDYGSHQRPAGQQGSSRCCGLVQHYLLDRSSLLSVHHADTPGPTWGG